MVREGTRKRYFKREKRTRTGEVITKMVGETAVGGGSPENNERSCAKPKQGARMEFDICGSTRDFAMHFEAPLATSSQLQLPTRYSTNSSLRASSHPDHSLTQHVRRPRHEARKTPHLPRLGTL